MQDHLQETPELLNGDPVVVLEPVVPVRSRKNKHKMTSTDLKLLKGLN